MNSFLDRFDYVLIGGGLQSGLIALALRHHRPEASVAIIEQCSQIGGNHTWSFHATDIPEKSSVWLRSLIEYSWPSYQVQVGGFERQVNIGYHTVSSDHFVGRLASAAASSGGRLRIFTAAKVVFADPQTVTLSDGRSIAAGMVIDNRGPQKQSPQRRDHESRDREDRDHVDRDHVDQKISDPNAGTADDRHGSPMNAQVNVLNAPGATFDGGFQKFWGFELALPFDWPTSVPVIMDDRIDQTDGFRFIYTLPMQSRRVLVEDTRFSNTSAIDRNDCFLQVDRYLKMQTRGKFGIEHCQILREEQGVLPMPSRGHFPGANGRTLAGGYRGGWFHAATGYSFPMAIRFAELVASEPASQLVHRVHLAARGEFNRARFSRLLNRLLFELVKPQKRYQIFRRFYRVLSDERVARFYRHQFTLFDATRIIVGVPPGGLRPIRFARSLLRTCFKVGQDSPPSSDDRSEPTGVDSATSQHPLSHTFSRERVSP